MNYRLMTNAELLAEGERLRKLASENALKSQALARSATINSRIAMFFACLSLFAAAMQLILVIWKATK